jgi:hypothetical protein
MVVVTNYTSTVRIIVGPTTASWAFRTSVGLATALWAVIITVDLLCSLVVRVLGYRSGGPGSIPGTTRKKKVGLERGSLSLVSTN